jgi:hypothetical protein
MAMMLLLMRLLLLLMGLKPETLRLPPPPKKHTMTHQHLPQGSPYCQHTLTAPNTHILKSS